MHEGNRPPAYHPSRNDPDSGSYQSFRTYQSFQKTTAGIRLGGHPSADKIDPRKIAMLPATAEEYFSDELEKFGWERHLKAVLCGTRDEHSPLKILREHEQTVIREIYSYVANKWACHVKLTIPAALVGQCFARGDKNTLLRFNAGRRNGGWERRVHLNDVTDVPLNCTSNGFDDGFVAFARCGYVEFPEPTGRKVNMMPFIFGSKESLPDNLQCYHKLIEQCPYMSEEIGNIGYLTVHESYVDATKAQRREGLHIESPGIFQDASGETSFQPAQEHPWGCGIMYGPDLYEGGIFMASSVSNTSGVWDALVDKDCPGIVDKHGGCEYLRPIIGEGTKLQAGELIWMTDCTPHEALPQEKSGNRQFFRVVSPYVSHWYADHSTKNSKVDIPKSVKVVYGNKFENGI